MHRSISNNLRERKTRVFSNLARAARILCKTGILLHNNMWTTYFGCFFVTEKSRSGRTSYLVFCLTRSYCCWFTEDQLCSSLKKTNSISSNAISRPCVGKIRPRSSVPSKVRKCAVPPDNLHKEIPFSRTWKIPKQWKSTKTTSYLKCVLCSCLDKILYLS